MRPLETLTSLDLDFPICHLYEGSATPRLNLTMQI